MTETVLSVKGLKVAYGGIQAVKGVDLEVRSGELIALIGANGAGKTTTMKAITGTLQPAAGEIAYFGRSIKGQGSYQLVGQGLAMVPEGRGVFARMTIVENLLMGAYVRDDTAQIQADIDRMFATFPRLKERAQQLAGTMSGGEQQMLAIGRALMAQPKILLLDEPSMGLAPILVEQIFDIITEINSRGTAVLLVEQNAMMALGIAKRGYILQIGEVTLEDSCAKLAKNPKVREAYLGV